MTRESTQADQDNSFQKNGSKPACELRCARCGAARSATPLNPATRAFLREQLSSSLGAGCAAAIVKRRAAGVALGRGTPPELKPARGALGACRVAHTCIFANVPDAGDAPEGKMLTPKRYLGERVDEGNVVGLAMKVLKSLEKRKCS